MAPNRRTQPRIQVEIPLRVHVPEREHPLSVLNQDLSWGGAQFLLPRALVHVGDTVALDFPWTSGTFFSVNAEVLRTQKTDDGKQAVAVRFTELSPANHYKLDKLLELLFKHRQGPEGDTPTLADTLELVFNDLDEMRETLTAASNGSISVTTFASYEPDQSIQVLLGGTGELPILKMRARIGEKTMLSGKGLTLYRLDLHLEHPIHELKAVIEHLLGSYVHHQPFAYAA